VTISVRKLLFRQLIQLGYFVWPLVGFFCFRIWGVFCGIIVAFMVDTFWPRWALNVSIAELRLAITNFLVLGVHGSHLYLRVGEHLLFVNRGEVRGRPALSLQVRNDLWSRYINGPLSDKFLKTWCDMVLPARRWRLNKYVRMLVSPERECPENCIISMLQECISVLNGSENSIQARVDAGRIATSELFKEGVMEKDLSEEKRAEGSARKRRLKPLESRE
jgi:hypothetical protein